MVKHTNSEKLYIPKSKEIRVEGANISYRQYGSGYPVICIPPWMGSSIVYVPLARELKGSGLELIALDMPGWGNRSKFISGTIDIDSYISLLPKIINKLGLKKYAIIGYSYGGVIAQGAITVENLKPEKLILVSSLNGGFDIFGTKRLKIAVKGLKAIKHSVDRKERLKKAYLYARRTSIAYSLRSTGANVEFVDMMLKDLGPLSIPSAMDSIYSLYGRSFLSNLLKEVDTTLIMGDRDYSYVKKGMKKISKFLGEEINIVLGNHHHLVFQPENSVDIILKQFKK